MDDRVAGKMKLLPIEKERKSDHRGTAAYIDVFQHIISSIAETSVNVLNDLGGNSGWNEQTKLLAKKKGEVVLRKLVLQPSVGDSKSAPKLSKLAEEKLAEIERLKTGGR